jgi:hypothetical protein
VYTTNGVSEPYCFTGLVPDVYRLEERNPDGYPISTTPDVWSLTLCCPNSTFTVLFGDKPLPTPTPTVTPTPSATPCAAPASSSICVMSYNDLNNNGVRDPGEPLIAGAVITVTNLSTGIVGVYTTTGNEPYCFHSLPPGLYRVEERNPDGYPNSTTPDIWSLTLCCPCSTFTVPFGDKPLPTPTPTVTPTPSAPPCATPADSSICVMSYNDLNNNGVRDPGEPLIAGAVITVTNLSTGIVGVYTTTGNEPYCFHSLPPGLYRVEERNPDGYPNSTTPDIWSLTLCCPSSTFTVPFGDKLIYYLHLPIIMKGWLIQPPEPPTPTPTSTSTPTPTQTPRPTRTPTHTPTIPPADPELIVNGGFETPGVWNTSRSERSTDQAHTGQWSMLIGSEILPNQTSYASIWQTVSIPIEANHVLLTFLYWPVSDDPSGDLQRGLIYDRDLNQPLATLFTTRSNARAWIPVTFDMSPWLGQTVNVYLGVTNDGDGLLTRMYVDDVSVFWW